MCVCVCVCGEGMSVCTCTCECVCVRGRRKTICVDMLKSKEESAIITRWVIELGCFCFNGV